MGLSAFQPLLTLIKLVVLLFVLDSYYKIWPLEDSRSRYQTNHPPPLYDNTEKIHKKQQNSCRSIIKHKDLAFSFLTICSSRPIEQYFFIIKYHHHFLSITDRTLSSLCLKLISAIAYIYYSL